MVAAVSFQKELSNAIVGPDHLQQLFVVSWLNVIVTQLNHYVPSGKEPSVNLQDFTLPQATKGGAGVVCMQACIWNK